MPKALSVVGLGIFTAIRIGLTLLACWKLRSTNTQTQAIKSVRLTLKLPRKKHRTSTKGAQKCKYIFFGLPAEHDNLGCGDTLFWGPCNKDPII